VGTAILEIRRQLMLKRQRATSGRRRLAAVRNQFRISPFTLRTHILHQLPGAIVENVQARQHQAGHGTVQACAVAATEGLAEQVPGEAGDGRERDVQRDLRGTKPGVQGHKRLLIVWPGGRQHDQHEVSDK
jgi:hypothetical protein